MDGEEITFLLQKFTRFPLNPLMTGRLRDEQDTAQRILTMWFTMIVCTPEQPIILIITQTDCLAASAGGLRRIKAAGKREFTKTRSECFLCAKPPFQFVIRDPTR